MYMLGLRFQATNMISILKRDLNQFLDVWITWKIKSLKRDSARDRDFRSEYGPVIQVKTDITANI
jgi:hypothetical protein